MSEYPEESNKNVKWFEWFDHQKLTFHPRRVADWLEGKAIAPIYVEMGLASGCNHRCIFCALDFLGYKPGFADTKASVRLMKEMGEAGVKSIMFGGEGEPLLHPDAIEIARAALDAGLDVAVTTNGVFLDKLFPIMERLSWVRISIDAGSPQTYASLHRAPAEDFHRVMDNLVQASSFPEVTVGAQMVLLKDNQREVSTLARKVREAGASYLMVKPYSRHPKSKHQLEVDYSDIDLGHLNEEFNTEKFKLIIRSHAIKKLDQKRSYEICWGSQFMVLITAKLDAIRCNLGYDDPSFRYGNLARESFQTIIKRIQPLKDLSGCRQNCRLDEINHYLRKLQNPPGHVNFI